MAEATAQVEENRTGEQEKMQGSNSLKTIDPPELRRDQQGRSRDGGTLQPKDPVGKNAGSLVVV